MAGTRTAASQGIPALTGLRFVAAMSVALAHGLVVMNNIPGTEPSWHRCLIMSAAFGMSTFFVLSGFVIHYNYSDSILQNGWRGFINFLVARFARLYPLYIVCIGLSLYDHGYFFSLFQGEQSATHDFWNLFPYYLTMTQSWRYSIVDSHALIYGYPFSVVIADSWSISTELFFYLTYPLICLVIFRLRRVWHTAAIAGLTAVVGLSLMLFAFHHMGAIDQMATEKFGPIASIAHGFQDSFVRWLLYFAPYSRLPEFLMGCLAAALYRQLETRAPSRVEQALGRLVPYLAIVAIAGAAVMVNRPANPFPFLNFLHLNFGLALPVVALIFCTSRYGGAASRALSWSWVVLGGEVSYSIYMLHPLIVRAAGLDAIPIGSTRALTSVAIIRLIVALVATVGLSIVSYQIIEAPARRLLRRLLTIDIAPLKAAPAETLP